MSVDAEKPTYCPDCEERVTEIEERKTDCHGTLRYGYCGCGRVVDQGDGWEPAAD